jgi:hypothetical protein
MRTKILPLVAKYAISRDFVGKNIFSMISQIWINYRNATLSKHDGDQDFQVKAGDRLPYFWIGSESIYDKLHQPKFHLLVFSNEQHNFPALRLELDKQYAKLLDCKMLPIDPKIAAIFGTTNSFNILLRPDNYIAFISAETSLSGLSTYLNSIFIAPNL